MITHPDKINKKMLESNHTVEQINLIDIYKIFHLSVAEYTFFKFTWNIVQDIEATKQVIANFKRLKA